jgi:hypothetical protein
MAEVKEDLINVEFVETSAELLKGIEFQFEADILLLVINSMFLEKKEVREIIEQFGRLANMINDQLD